MSQPETVAPRKTEAKKQVSGKTRRAVKLVGTAAVVAGGAAAVAVARQRRKVEIIIPESMIFPDASYVTKAAEATRRMLGQIVIDSLTTDEAAAVLMASPVAVERRIRKRVLYGFQFDRIWLLPKFQFRESRTVCNVEQVLPCLDTGLHAIEVVNWFTLPNADLVIEDAPVSPIEWLEVGGDPRQVMDLAKWMGSGL